jgi:apolipoprotein N-acyltransferase
MSRSASFLIALTLGLASVPGFAPFDYFFLPVLTLAGLFFLWRQATPGRAILVGYGFGLGLFGAGVSWVYVSIHQFGGMSMPLAVLATVLFCAFLALFTALAGWLASLAAKRAYWPVAVAVCWLSTEWLRGWVLTGFPWLAMGYAQAPASWLAGYAPLLGVYGVSLVVALSAGLLSWGVKKPLREGLPLLAAIIVIWLTGWGLLRVNWTYPVGEPVSVALLQGSIPQEMKWREGRAIATLTGYREMIYAASEKLIILPETALPLFHDNIPTGYLDGLVRHARKLGGDILVGVPERLGDGSYYNSVISLGSSPAQIYRKQHLVPFGEYIPLKPIFGWIIEVLHIPLSDFSRGTFPQPPLEAGGQRLAVGICYEDAFGEETIAQLPAATMLVNVSNDAWFGDSIAPWQHMQIAQMRALETGRYMLRANNTGITALIDEKGRALRMLPPFRPGVLTGSAQGMQGATPYVRWGNFGVGMTSVVLLGLAFFFRRP